MPSTRMTEAEWQTRVDLAACYRLVDLFGCHLTPWRNLKVSSVQSSLHA
jgi:hypothetical protein